MQKFDAWRKQIGLSHFLRVRFSKNKEKKCDRVGIVDMQKRPTLALMYAILRKTVFYFGIMIGSHI